MKKIISIVLLLALTGLLLTGCGSSAKDKEIAALEQKAEQSRLAADAAKKEHDKNQALVKNYYDTYNAYTKSGK